MDMFHPDDVETSVEAEVSVVKLGWVGEQFKPLFPNI